MTNAIYKIMPKPEGHTCQGHTRVQQTTVPTLRRKMQDSSELQS
jgi:hypothetical protein